MLVGYARVSAGEQKPELQLDALRQVGCERIFIEKASGARRNRPELKAALDYMRDGAGDVLVVWKRDRLARSLRQLIETVEDLDRCKVGLRSPKSLKNRKRRSYFLHSGPQPIYRRTAEASH